MQAIEFKPNLQNGQIVIPPSFLELIKKSKKMRVIILIEDELDEPMAWQLITAQSFLDGYTETDSVYDNECE